VISEKKLSFNKTLLTNPPARYGLSGFLDFKQPHEPQFSINVTATDGSAEEILSHFLTKFPLQAVVNGNLIAHGNPADFLLQSKLVLNEGTLYGQHFQKGEIDLEITHSQVSFTKVRLWKERSVVNGSGWISFKKQFFAKITSEELHTEDLDLLKGLAPHIQADLSTEITGSGDFQTPEFHGQAKVKELVVSNQNLGEGKLHMTLLAKNLAFEASLGQTQASGLLKLEQDLPIKTNLTFVDLPLSSFLKPFYPAAFENITLLCSGRMAISGKAQDPQSLQIQGTFTHLTADIGGYKVANEGDEILELENGLLQVKSFQLKGEGTSLSILGEVKLKEYLNLFVNGEADLDIFRLLTHEFSYGKGKAYLVLKITDQWNDPKIHGGLTVQEGTLRSETLGQTITITSMGLFFNQKQILLENLEGEAGGGHLKATGKLELKNLVPDNFGLLVDLMDAKANLGEGFSLVFNGSFAFQGNLQSHQLRGEAQIQRAAYTRRVDLKSFVLELQKTQNQAIQPTPFLGETKLNVHFGGRDNIWINNNVAKLPLEVDLFLKGTFDHPLLFGHVEARDGEVYFRNHVFKVQSGTLDFINPNQIVPILDLKAETTIRNYQVEMSLAGKLDKDKPLGLQLVSDPPLSETDILALLTVGKTAEELAAQPGQATGEAISVPTSVLFDEFVEDKVKELTGIDRFQVDPYATSSKAAAGPRLTVQKRLLDDQLTVTYISAIDPSEEDVIKMEYQLGRNVSIIAERDENGRLGGDLTLRLEFR
jgi:translocation and assembly module TamB